MSMKDYLGDRMKEFYEDRSRFYLTRRTPVIIRIDGRCFHSFTHNFDKPYDRLFHNSMNKTLQYLCKNIQGCKFGYTQSDEISLVLTDYDTLTTDGWFDYNLQKMCSISASMATLSFNKYFEEFFMLLESDVAQEYETSGDSEWFKKMNHLFHVYHEALNSAMFDARVFSIPEKEVCNYFIWRQKDATRNAIRMLGQTHFSHKKLEEKSCDDIQDMLFLEKQINFNDMPVEFKRGVCCYRKETPCIERKTGYKKEWVLDKECPIFTQDRNYVEQHIQTINND